MHVLQHWFYLWYRFFMSSFIQQKSKKFLCRYRLFWLPCHQKTGKITIFAVKLMDFFTELYLSCVGTPLMLLVMMDKHAFKMWQKQFLLLSCFCLFSSLSNITSVVHQGFPTKFSWQCCGVHLKPSWKYSFESSMQLQRRVDQTLGKVQLIQFTQNI